MNSQTRISDNKVSRESAFVRKSESEPASSMCKPLDGMMRLQRTIGNQAVQRLLCSGLMRAKLPVNQPVDSYEQEADRAAEQVMPMSEPGIQIAPLVQRQGEGQRLLTQGMMHVVQQIHNALSPIVQRAETDTKGQCEGLKDVSDDLNAFVNDKLQSVRQKLDKPVKPSEMVAKTYYAIAQPSFVFLSAVEEWANNQPKHRGGGYFAKKGTKYENVDNSLFSYLAPAVNLNGNCVGTDKIGHMFQQGFQYFVVSSKDFSAAMAFNIELKGKGKGDEYAKAWGEWTEGVLSEKTKKNPKLMKWLEDTSKEKGGLSPDITGYEQGYFGLQTTGVHSRADLSANEAGLKFYNELYRNPSLSFDIRKYVSANWDEEKSGNIYRDDVGKAVEKAGRLTKRDVVLSGEESKKYKNNPK